MVHENHRKKRIHYNFIIFLLFEPLTISLDIKFPHGCFKELGYILKRKRTPLGFFKFISTNTKIQETWEAKLRL